jgi:hypothetical protein
VGRPDQQEGDPTVALVLAAGRCAVGISGLLAPRLVIRFFLGRQQTSPALVLLARLTSIRDLLLGVATLDALRQSGSARRLLWIGALVDATDGALTLVAHPTVPTRTRRIVAAIAWSSAATAVWQARRFDGPR